MQQVTTDCGHDLPIVTRTFNSGNGPSVYSICINCKDKDCFNEFVIKEGSQ